MSNVITRISWPLVLVMFMASGASGCSSFSSQILQPMEDARLAHRVGHQICDEKLNQNASIDVVARSGVVTLRGTAATDDQAEKIALSAHTVAGVSRVENRLRAAENDPAGGKAARTLVEDVRSALEDGLPGRGPRLQVDAEARTVYLSGIVPDADTKLSAVTIALNVVGVDHVEDNLVSERP